ncbi:ribosomal protection-like ABC-F family protein [Paenibacillus sp. GYB003]|uniref:ribosomal protection-like ABC-F family protein n=1 Tax=Paenibacillus sp. GYB003 TaxID=2994392 RepID=UPI002F969C88
MMLCTADTITKTWGGTPVIQQLSLEVREGDRIGLVGPNGCGKTTLLKLLAGSELPDSGTVRWKKGSRAALLAQIPDYGQEAAAGDVLREALSDLYRMRDRMEELESLMASRDPEAARKALSEYGALQDAFSAQGGYEADASLSRVANGLGIARLLPLPFAGLSGGERTKVCLGRMLLQEPDLLLLDEPTNHLDLAAVEWLESYLQTYRGSVLIVSHDRYFLDRVVNKIVDLEGGAADVYHGNYSRFVEEKERRLLAEFAAYQEQQKKIGKMEEAIKRLRAWAAQADNPALFKRAAAMRKAIDRMEKIDRPVLERRRMGLAFDVGERGGSDVVVMEDVRLSHRTAEDGVRTLYDGVGLRVRHRDFAAIVGANGSGKSTLLRMIAEGLKPDEGTVKLGSGVRIGYLAQQDLFPDERKTVLDAFRDAVAVEEGEARRLLAGFLFYGASVFRSVGGLSGGERMRLRLAQLMHRELNVLVLDEPTNHLDIDARETLEEALASFPGTVVCVSHDRYLLNKLFPVTYWLEGGKLTRYEGTYAEAKRKREELGAGGTANAAAGVESACDGGRVRERALPRDKAEDARRERLEAKLEADIAAVERKLALLDEAMMAEEEASKLMALHGEKAMLEAERELLYERLADAGHR